jgi:hypothetical protein
MEKLIQLLLLLVNKAQFNSESERDDALDLLRALADDLLGAGTSSVPPKPGPTNAPADPAPVVDPGVVAEPVPVEEQTPPPTSPEIAGAAPEESNAFSATE